MAAHDQSEATTPWPDPGIPPPPPTPPPVEDPVAEPGPRPEAADPSSTEDPLEPPPAPPELASTEDPLGPPPAPPGLASTEDLLGPPPGLAGLAGAEDPLGPLPTGPQPGRDAIDDAVMVPLADGTAEMAATERVAEPDGKKSRLDVNGTQLCASTLAAVSAAVVSSVFGVTGTVVGAAVGSVLATTGTAFYSHGLRRTSVKLQQTQAVQLSRWARLWAGGRVDNDPPSGPDYPAGAMSGAADDGDGDDRPAWREWLAKRHSGLVLGVVIVFVASMATITMVELVGRGPIAGASGNDSSGSTSIGSFLDADSNSDKNDGLDPSEGEQAPGDTDTTVASDDPAATDDGSTDTSPTGDGSTDTTVDASDPGTDPGVTEPPAEPADPGTDPGADSGATAAG